MVITVSQGSAASHVHPQAVFLQTWPTPYGPLRVLPYSI